MRGLRRWFRRERRASRERRTPRKPWMSLLMKLNRIRILERISISIRMRLSSKQIWILMMRWFSLMN